MEEVECAYKTEQSLPKVHGISNNDIQVFKQTEEGAEYYDDAYVGEEPKNVHLMKQQMNKLPCPEELSDPTELPLSRESIGLDLSWLSSSASHRTFTISSLYLSVIISILFSVTLC